MNDGSLSKTLCRALCYFTIKAVQYLKLNRQLSGSNSGEGSSKHFTSATFERDSPDRLLPDCVLV